MHGRWQVAGAIDKRQTEGRGAAKNKSTDPRAFAKSKSKSQTHSPPTNVATHPPSDFLFLDFFFKYVFGRFSARGVQKHH
jgi:hypothetical protein